MITAMIFSEVGAKVRNPLGQAVNEGCTQFSTGKSKTFT